MKRAEIESKQHNILKYVSKYKDELLSFSIYYYNNCEYYVVALPKIKYRGNGSKLLLESNIVVMHTNFQSGFEK